MNISCDNYTAIMIALLPIATYLIGLATLIKSTKYSLITLAVAGVLVVISYFMNRQKQKDNCYVLI